MIWNDDVLGQDFSATTVPVPGRGAHRTATVVRHNPSTRAESRGTVLYVHGWSDYFANPELAEAVQRAGFRFYAVDLHGYGRNLTDEVLAAGDVPGLAEDLSEYQPDFDAAREVIARDGGRIDPGHLVVVAHSTGGLTMSLLLMEQPGQVAGLALATPWIAPQGFSGIDRIVLALAPLLPKRLTLMELKVPLNSNYHRVLSRDREGAWEVDPRWRPRTSFPVTVGFLRSTAAARERLLELHRSGRTVQAPVLIQTARRSLLVPWWDKRMHGMDTVLDVEAIRRRAAVLHPAPTVVAHDDAIHDVHRSAPLVRRAAFADLQRWLVGLEID